MGFGKVFALLFNPVWVSEYKANILVCKDLLKKKDESEASSADINARINTMHNEVTMTLDDIEQQNDSIEEAEDISYDGKLF
jgi:hypothetical protein